MKTAQDWINELELQEHPEGGYYKRITEVDANGRAAASSIYYLLRKGEVSKIHRFDANEYWAWHAGGSGVIHLFNDAYQSIEISANRPQQLITKDQWFGVSIEEGAYLLCSCIVVPGFLMETHEFADEEQLIAKFPAQESLIRRLV